MREAQTAAEEAVDAIVEDLLDRRGLDHAWDAIDHDIRVEIKASRPPSDPLSAAEVVTQAREQAERLRVAPADLEVVLGALGGAP